MARGSSDTALFIELRDILLDEGYLPGDPLPSEGRLIERFGCSRSSIREALKQLQTLGLVEIRRGIGTYVGPLTVDPLFDAIAVGTVLRSRVNSDAFLELLETRIALDMGMADVICAHFQGNPDDELDSIVAEMINAARSDTSFTKQDRLFHQRLQAAIGNQFASDLVTNFWEVFASLGLDDRFGRQVPALEVADSHRALLDAAYAGDAEAYRSAVERHYRGSRAQAQLFSEAQTDLERRSRPAWERNGN